MFVEGLGQGAAGNQHGDGAGARHDAAAETEDAHAQAFDVILDEDFLGKPAGGLSSAEGARDDVNLIARLVVHLLIELETVASIETLNIGGAIEAEGEAAKERSARHLRRPEACGREA